MEEGERGLGLKIEWARNQIIQFNNHSLAADVLTEDFSRKDAKAQRKDRN